MVAVLSVSGTALHDCDVVINAMMQLGVNGNVMKNTTILDGDLERGCRVTITSEPCKENAKRVWEHLEKRCSLTCAHVEVRSDIMSGCVKDVFRPSLCNPPKQ